MSNSNANTTSFALLGQLAIRSWSAYELTQQMQRATVRWVWPRAESRIYGQLKRLAELGYASAESDVNGRRRRTVYTITPAGRAALRDWLSAEDAAAWRLEDELLLRVSLADHGDLDALTRTLERATRDVMKRLEVLVPLTRDLADTGGKNPERAHLSALMAEAGLREVIFRAELLEWMSDVTAQWASTAGDELVHSWGRASLDDTATEMASWLDRLGTVLGDAALPR